VSRLVGGQASVSELADEGGGTRLTFTEQTCIIPPSDRRNGWGGLQDGLERFLAGDRRAA